MVRRLFLIALFFSKFCLGQSQGKDSLLLYTEVIAVDSSGHKELALRARKWFGENFKNPRDVLQLADIDNGELLGNGSFQYSATLKAYGVSQATAGYISVKISVRTKENKYKYEIGPFSIESVESSHGGANKSSFYITQSETHPSNDLLKANKKTKDGLNEWWALLKKQCDTKAASLINSLKRTMETSYNEDW